MKRQWRLLNKSFGIFTRRGYDTDERRRYTRFGVESNGVDYDVSILDWKTDRVTLYVSRYLDPSNPVREEVKYTGYRKYATFKDALKDIGRVIDILCYGMDAKLEDK